MLLEAHSLQRLGGHKTWTSVNKNIGTLTARLQAYRPSDSPVLCIQHPTSCSLLENYFTARCCAPVFFVRQDLFFFFNAIVKRVFFFPSSQTLSQKDRRLFMGSNQLQMKLFLSCVTVWGTPKWTCASGTKEGKNTPKMSTLLYHPLEIDCITFKKVALGINSYAIFQERRRWAQSAGCSFSLLSEPQTTPGRISSRQLCPLSRT